MVVMTKYLSLHDPFALSYARLLDRIESFKEAPEHLKKLLPAIDEAGFFYTGEGYVTQCFYCAISINELEKYDHPWIEHAYWFHYCPYLLGNKSNKWIRQAFNARARLMDGHVIIDLPVDDPASPSRCHICSQQNLRIAFYPVDIYVPVPCVLQDCNIALCVERRCQTLFVFSPVNCV
jgi:hypothetical protein